MKSGVIAYTGLAELRVALQAAPAEIQKLLPKALLAGAGPGAAAARAAAPRSDAGNKKHLADNITIRATKYGAKVGSPLIQAPIIHFGRYAHVPGGGKVAAHTRHLHPQNWLIGPLEGRADEIADSTATAIDELLDRLVGS
jgi:hypothetical protein